MGFDYNYYDLSKILSFYIRDSINAYVCRNGRENFSLILKWTLTRDGSPVLVKHKDQFLECSGVTAYLEDVVHEWGQKDYYPGRFVYECKSLKTIDPFLDFSTTSPLSTSTLEHTLDSDLVERAMKMFDRPVRPSAANLAPATNRAIANRSSHHGHDRRK